MTDNAVVQDYTGLPVDFTPRKVHTVNTNCVLEERRDERIFLGCSRPFPVNMHGSFSLFFAETGGGDTINPY